MNLYLNLCRVQGSSMSIAISPESSHELVYASSRTDEDTPWKNILDHYFRFFIEYCLPNLAVHINWSRGYESLDKELRKVSRDTAVGNRLVDKLLKVWLQDDKEVWVLFHLEVQGRWESEFAK